MKAPQEHHEAVIKEISGQFREILDGSSQAIYIYLDDAHKVCNKKFASLLGYKSAEEWSSADVPFDSYFADDTSQKALVSAYSKAMEEFAGSSISVNWKRRSGGTVATNVILVPIANQGHLFALHFISEK